MKFIAANIASILCILIAGFMLYKDKTGWGWFLFAGIILFLNPKMKNDDSSTEP